MNGSRAFLSPLRRSFSPPPVRPCLLHSRRLLLLPASRRSPSPALRPPGSSSCRYASFLLIYLPGWRLSFHAQRRSTPGCPAARCPSDGRCNGIINSRGLAVRVSSIAAGSPVAPLQGLPPWLIGACGMLASNCSYARAPAAEATYATSPYNNSMATLSSKDSK